MFERETRGISLEEIVSGNSSLRIFGLFISFLLVLSLASFGLATGFKIIVFAGATLFGYIFFKGASFLSFLAFLGIITCIRIYRFHILPGHIVSITLGEPIIIVIVTFFVIFYSKNFQKMKIVSDPFKIPLLLILLASVLSLTQSQNTFVSIFWLCFMGVGYLLYRWMVHFGIKDFRKSFDIAVFIFTIFILLSIVRLYISPPQVQATTKLGSIFANRFVLIFTGPNAVAGIISTLFPLVILYIKYHNFPYKIFWFVVLLLGLYILYITASRNGFFASYAAIITTTFLVVNKKKRITVGLAVFCFLLIFTIVNPVIMRRIFTIFNYQLDTSALARIILWIQAISAFKNHLFTGIGVGNFFYLPMSMNFSAAHNQLFNILSEIGIIGGVGYIILLYLIFKFLIHSYMNNVRTKKINFIYSGSLIGSWVAFTAHNIFDCIWAAPHHPKEAMFFWLLLALTAIIIHRAERGNGIDRV